MSELSPRAREALDAPRRPPPPRPAPRRFFVVLTALGLIGLLAAAAFALNGLRDHAQLRVSLAEAEARTETLGLALRLAELQRDARPATEALQALGRSVDPLASATLRGTSRQSLERLRPRLQALRPAAPPAPAEAASASPPLAASAEASAPEVEAVPPPPPAPEPPPPPAPEPPRVVQLPSAEAVDALRVALRHERLRVQALPPLAPELLAAAVLALLLILAGLGGRGAAIGREQAERAERAEALQLEAEASALALRHTAHENEQALQRLAPHLQAVAEGHLAHVLPVDGEALAAGFIGQFAETLAELRLSLAQTQESAGRVAQGLARVQAASAQLQSRGEAGVQSLRELQLAFEGMVTALGALGESAPALQALALQWPHTLQALRAQRARQAAAVEPAAALCARSEALALQLEAALDFVQALADWRTEAARLSLNADLQAAQPGGRDPRHPAEDWCRLIDAAEALIQPGLEARAALRAAVAEFQGLARAQLDALDGPESSRLASEAEALDASEALIAALPERLAALAEPEAVSALRASLDRSVEMQATAQADHAQSLLGVQAVLAQAEGLQAALARFRTA
ncbi:hypothetical protein [Aquariibacter albus]|uniref:Uncharacterized protein n=1 Tax=Aquariibacter albus TaxID=2759899 RepID=A0A839HT80_9BURK|nr:hypothetical protein [Aquariibacter albus]MBB1162740.1 hypothetical protein [Aquariibacter albus]